MRLSPTAAGTLADPHGDVQPLTAPYGMLAWLPHPGICAIGKCPLGGSEPPCAPLPGACAGWRCAVGASWGRRSRLGPAAAPLAGARRQRVGSVPTTGKRACEIPILCDLRHFPIGPLMQPGQHDHMDTGLGISIRASPQLHRVASGWWLMVMHRQDSILVSPSYHHQRFR